MNTTGVTPPGSLRIAVVQQDFPVGDIHGNRQRVLDALAASRATGPDLLVFPELTLTGYPPEDLLYRHGFISAADQALESLLEHVTDVDVLIGHPQSLDGQLYNAVSWIRQGTIVATYRKQSLPNYAVFDEKRYFSADDQAVSVTLNGVRVGLLICEDIWVPGPTRRAVEHGCDLIVVPNASPYHLHKRSLRESTISERAITHQCPILYANLVGGQDELVFDGRSFACNADGALTGPTGLYQEGLFEFLFDRDQGFSARGWQPADAEDTLEAIYQTLVRGTRDYLHKNGFQKALLGLSGGIDSALTLAVAADALGADQVEAVMMPSRHTSQLSLDLAAEQAQRMGVRYRSIPIAQSFDVLAEALQPAFDGQAEDVTEENMQARLRAVMLMAISNKTGAMLLTTGNKSELAVGYCTIYGDMCGGYAPIKDCAKMLVYQLSEYRNGLSPIIPEGVIRRAPTAELSPGQMDQDSLPPYPVLDEIISRYVEQDQSIDEIVAAGHDRQMVERLAYLVRINEYKRRQSAPGVRITERAFGRDRRYPITNGWQY